jgi:hypothetical protein
MESTTITLGNKGKILFGMKNGARKPLKCYKPNLFNIESRKQRTTMREFRATTRFHPSHA